MAITDILDDNCRQNFYPTPADLADRLLEGLPCYEGKFSGKLRILEPSAGKGDLVEAIWNHCVMEQTRKIYKSNLPHIDCIEISPMLLPLLSEKCKRLSAPFVVDDEYDTSIRAICSVVHDDFLSFDTRQPYDWIVMNPPFSNGDLHLLKAIRLMEHNGGHIRCILNAETLRNPYTNRRKLLSQLLTKYDAEIEFVENAFSNAERKTDVEVAIVKIVIPMEDISSTKTAQQLRSQLRIAQNAVRGSSEKSSADESENTDIAITDAVANVLARFNFEVDAGLKLLEDYFAYCPYLSSEYESEQSSEFYSGNRYPIIDLNIQRRSNENSSFSSNKIHASYYWQTVKEQRECKNAFLAEIRYKYWTALLDNRQITWRFTNRLRDKYRTLIYDFVDYDFTAFNIKNILCEMNAEAHSFMQKEIFALFDKLTVEYSWYPESSSNIHYYNGWATNKAHRIGMKVIVPTGTLFGVERSYDYENQFYSTLEDLEKVLSYLNGDELDVNDLLYRMQRADRNGQTKNIDCRYFTVTVYKKGTMHITFKNKALLDRYNIICGKNRNWLPPFYGQKPYSEMDKDERSVVDSFNGTGVEGSGAEAYEEIYANPDRYLEFGEKAVLCLPNAIN